MLIKILIGLAVILALVAIVAALQPAAFRVERSTTISAPIASVFARVNDLHQFKTWSPWEKLDPAMTTSFEGPPAGPGASYTWAGNAKAGEGRMSIITTQPNALIQMKLEFLKPFKATNTVEFSFKSVGDKTSVVWSMSGVNGFMFKVVGLFMNMDKMVGGDFEQGLANLKSLSEAGAVK